MKMTIDEFNKKVAADKKRRENLDAEIKELLQRIADLEADAGAAAAAGDTVTYKAKLQERADAETDLFVKRTCSDNMKNSVTQDDALAAWNNYVPGYNSSLKKAIAAFEEKKAALLKAYSDMVDIQRAALAIREDLSAAVGASAESFKMDCLPVMSAYHLPGALRLVGFNCPDPDACYYLACHAKENNLNYVVVHDPDPELGRVWNTLVGHNSKLTF